MTTALPTTAYPQHFLDGYLDVAAGLCRLGITVIYTPLTGAIASWIADTTTLRLREDGPLEGHLAAMMDLWRRIVLGISASCVTARPGPRHLRVVHRSG